MTKYNTKYFASIRDEKTVYVLHTEDGLPVTSISDEEFNEHSGFICDVQSGLGIGYEHINGIVLTNEDAKLLNLEFIDYR